MICKACTELTRPCRFGRIVYFLAVAFLTAAISGPASAGIEYPADTVVDVTGAPYFADSTGLEDATAAIQAAMDDHDGNAANNWRLTHFGTPDNTGHATDSANPDKDMLVNLQERAFGLDPLLSDNDHPVHGGICFLNGEPYVTLTYVRLTSGSGTDGDGYTASGIEYSIEATRGSPAHWHPGTDALILHQGPFHNGDGSESLIFRSIEPLHDGNENALFRVLLKPAP